MDNCNTGWMQIVKTLKEKLSDAFITDVEDIAGNLDKITFDPTVWDNFLKGKHTLQEVLDYIDQVGLENGDNNNQGESMGVTITNNINTLLTVANTEKIVVTREYLAGTGRGKGAYFWDENKLKSEHNGGSVIDPTVVFPQDLSNETQVQNWFNTSNSGTGCWVLFDEPTVNNFGATFANPIFTSYAINAYVNSMIYKNAKLEGTFLVAQNIIKLPSNTNLDMTKAVLKLDTTTALSKVNDKATDVYAIIRAEDVSNVVVRGGRIYGESDLINGDGTSKGFILGVDFYNVNNGIVENVNISGLTASAIRAGGSTFNSWGDPQQTSLSKDITIRNNTITGCGIQYTDYLDNPPGGPESGAQGDNDGKFQPQIKVEYSSRIKVIDNTLLQSRADATQIGQSNHVVVKGNTVKNSHMGAIFILDLMIATITNNQSYNAGSRGFTIEAIQQGIITDNYSGYSGREGFRVAGGVNLQVNDNTSVVNGSKEDDGTSASRNSEISLDKFRTDSDFPANVQVKDNFIVPRSTSKGAVYIEGVNRCKITGNMIKVSGTANNSWGDTTDASRIHIEDESKVGLLIIRENVGTQSLRTVDVPASEDR